MPNFYKDEFPANLDAAESDIYHAGIFLGCTFGVAALYVWAVGILAAGQSSTMTGTYAGQFAMEGFIQIRMPQWKRILITRSLAIAPTLFVTVFSGGIDHISGLNDFLNCVQMIQLPFALVPVLTFVSDKRIMGNYRLNTFGKAFAIPISLLVLLINFYFLYNWIDEQFGYTAVSISFSIFLAIVYLIFVIYLTYYCLLAMDFIRDIKSKYLPAPIYSDFDQPWLEDEKYNISIASSMSNESPKPEEKLDQNTPNKENNDSKTSPSEKIEAPKVPLPHETPAAVRNRRHLQKELHMSSPSDSMLSPCTSKLFGKKAMSGPTALLRSRQQSAIPFKIDAAAENDDDE
ncbi:unnamed protein product [Caenorhabditis auriculariae]|uniref:Uncharacterized protein n=1 Tax=Caenorhabditis auriculariae TaxID=2777116 RepID=A0A8S1HG82_9PELO|nr:unnamed protein product [Caenorhabditis auriculariae]